MGVGEETKQDSAIGRRDLFNLPPDPNAPVGRGRGRGRGNNWAAVRNGGPPPGRPPIQNRRANNSNRQ